MSGLDPTNPANYTPGPSRGCGLQTDSNVKVNQDCLNLSDPDLQGRAQAQNETFIAQNPHAPHHCPGTGVAGVPPAVCLGSASNAAVANDQDVYTDAVSVPH